MGVGMIALVLLVPAIVVAVILAIVFAFKAARTGQTLTTIACLVSLVMIASPLLLASFATRPQGDENPIFLIEYGIFPSAVLAVVALGAGFVLRKRYRQLTTPALLLASLVFLGRVHNQGDTPSASSLDGALQGLQMVGVIALATYPLTWLYAFRELSEYVAPRLAKPKQG
jgi:hypothetical protein